MDGVAKEHRTVSRVTTILERVATSDAPLSLHAIVAMLDAPKSSVQGLIKGLVATGYLDETPQGYRVGPAVNLLSPGESPPVIASARHALQAIQHTCDETATLCTLVGDSVVYIDRVESTQMIRYSPPLRVRRPLYPTSAGKCFLSLMPRVRQSRLLSSIDVRGDRLDAALAELVEVAKRGYATNRDETVADVYAVASPIVVRNRAVACLQIAGPSSRMAAAMDELGRLVLSHASRLSDRTSLPQ
jgi:DNA-binding IclR family transcriptional regulator